MGDDVIAVGACAALGAALAIGWLAALRANVDAIVRGAHSLAMFWFALRALGVFAGFALATHQGPWSLLACLLGFVGARTLALPRLRGAS